MKTKKKKSGGGSSGGGAQQFLLLHGEKIAVGIVIVVALWFAAQGILGYRAMDWHPNELETLATEAENSIRNSTRTAEEELAAANIDLDRDHAAFAEQIKAPIPVVPYRGRALWNPAPFPIQTGTQSQFQGF
jgi:hypothetical protein